MKSERINSIYHFKEEIKVLNKANILYWEEIKDMKDQDLNRLLKRSYARLPNLKKLRCIARFIVELKITDYEAFILMHSGIPSVESLSRMTPNQIVNATGRLERTLSTNRESPINLNRAQILVKMAKEFRNLN